jgi:threonine dehydrogenase-like Zn-dependent dehydrogenase
MRLAMSLLRWGKVGMRPLITHLVPPADGPALFAKMEAADPDILGVVFDWTQLGA